MRASLLLFTAPFLLAPVFAQARQTHEYDNHYGGTTSFSTRGGVPGAVDGVITQMVPAEFTRAVGGMKIRGSNTTRVNAVRMVNQDEDALTQETFEFGFLLDDPTRPGQPDPNPRGSPPRPTFVLSLGPNTTPVNSGRRAWRWTITLATPADGVVPADGNWYLGHTLPPNSGWPNDGLSVHAANMVATNAAPLGEMPSTGAVRTGSLPEHVHTIQPSGTALLVTGSDDLAVFFSVVTEAPVLEIGAHVDPNRSVNRVNATVPYFPRNYGTAGWFPDHAVRGDGLAFKLEDKNAQFDPGAILFSFPLATSHGFASGGRPIDPLFPGTSQSGGFWLDAAGYAVLGFSMPARIGVRGMFEAAVLPYGRRFGPFGDVTAQGVVFDTTAFEFRFSNAVKFRSL